MLRYGRGRVFGDVDRLGSPIRCGAGVLGLPADAAVAGGLRLPTLRRADGLDDDQPPAGLRQLSTPGVAEGARQQSDPAELRGVAGARPTAIIAVGGSDARNRTHAGRRWCTGRAAGRSETDAPWVCVGAVHEVRSARVPVPGGSPRSARAVLQPDSGGGWQDPVAVSDQRASGGGAPASRGRPAVPHAHRGVLAGLRAVGRRPTRRAWGGLARGGQKRGLPAAFAGEVVAQIDALVGSGTVDDWDLEAIETAARRKAVGVAAGAA